MSFTPIVAQGNETGKSCCKYNNKRTGDCEFNPSKNGLKIEWSDGVIESYTLISQRDLASKTYADRIGGVWEYFLYPQGNQSLTNRKNGNIIFKPLRGCANISI